MSKSLRDTDPNRFAALKAEAASPFRNLRLFFYAGFGISGLTGAFVFFFRILAGRELETTIPNFGLQMGLVVLMGWLFRLESQAKQRAIASVQAEMNGLSSSNTNLKKT
jgi:Low psii accumulation1 / Rep27